MKINIYFYIKLIVSKFQIMHRNLAVIHPLWGKTVLNQIWQSVERRSSASRASESTTTGQRRPRKIGTNIINTNQNNKILPDHHRKKFRTKVFCTKTMQRDKNFWIFCPRLLTESKRSKTWEVRILAYSKSSLTELAVFCGHC